MKNSLTYLKGEGDEDAELLTELRAIGIEPEVVQRLQKLPGSADTLSGMPLLIADAAALERALEDPRQQQSLQDAECIILGSQSEQKRLQKWLATSTAVFLHRPANLEFLRDLLRDYRDEAASTDKELEAAAPAIELDQFGLLYGSSKPMHKLYRQLRKAASSDASLCLYGESGTGKELAAQTVHRYSQRAPHPFKAVNCSAIPSELFESELFGHEKGSFSGATDRKIGMFESVGQGTLLLDEITEMDKELQAKLLRILETGHFNRIGGTEAIASNARIITATNRKPRDAVQFGRLRDDLYYRISQLEVHLPTLRERSGDIVQLARLFAYQFGQETGKNAVFSKAAETVLANYQWPGNVRQLWNMVQIACTTGKELITPDDFPDLDSSNSPRTAGSRISIDLGSSLQDAEKVLILATLQHCGGNKQRAANILGISLRTLYTRLKNYQS